MTIQVVLEGLAPGLIIGVREGIETAPYLGYLVFAALVYLRIRSGRISIVTAPLRQGGAGPCGARIPVKADSM